MLSNRNNPQLWFAWYPVRVSNSIFPIRWMTKVWWRTEYYICDGYVNVYEAR